MTLRLFDCTPQNNVLVPATPDTVQHDIHMSAVDPARNSFTFVRCKALSSAEPSLLDFSVFYMTNNKAHFECSVPNCSHHKAYGPAMGPGIEDTVMGVPNL